MSATENTYEDESWSNWLISQAQSYELKAYRAQQNIHKIQAELEYLHLCLQPLKDLHTLQTWDSKAATFSRIRLNGRHSLSLQSLIQKLEALIQELTAYSHIWSINSQDFLRLLQR